MGLFDLFKSDKKNSEVVNDEFQLDLKKLLETAEIYDAKRKLTKYNCPLEKTILNFFDSIIIIINSSEKIIEDKDTVSIVFLNSSKTFNNSQAEHVVNTMTKLCKVENERWRDSDANHINGTEWRGRTFLDINGASIYIEKDEINGLTLTISNYKKFIETL